MNPNRLQSLADAAFMAADELRWVGDVGHARINAEARYLERKLDELAKWAEDEADAVIEARTG